MSQMLKRKVNRSKRAKIGSHGFKVYKNTYVYIGKPAVREEIVDRIKELWNNDKSISNMRKYIEGISIQYHKNPKRGGRWYSEEKRFEFIDYSWLSINSVDEVVYHEVIGHAFWDFARIWRREELTRFNELANKLPPVNDYVAKYKDSKRNDDMEELEAFDKKWGEWNENEECSKAYNELITKLKSNGHDSMTRYANEQHSAITELIMHGSSYHTKKGIVVNEEQIEELKKLWMELHY